MVPLMSRIAWEISNKVANVINPKTIVVAPAAEAKKKISDGKNLLEAWSKVNDVLNFWCIFKFANGLKLLGVIKDGNLIGKSFLSKQITWRCVVGIYLKLPK